MRSSTAAARKPPDAAGLRRCHVPEMGRGIGLDRRAIGIPSLL